MSQPSPDSDAIKWHGHPLVPALAVLLLLGVVLGGSEIVVRLAGYGPWAQADVGYTVEPGDRLFQQDSITGYAHRAGRYHITFRDGYAFTVTHAPNTLRLTHLPDSAPAGAGRRAEIWIFGCSFTHGWAVNDSDTFAWRLQLAMPAYEIVNYGVSGFGEVHMLRRFQAELARGVAPRAVVLAYGSFHDVRNTAGRGHRKVAVRYSRLPDMRLPMARVDDGGRLKVSMPSLEYTSVPLARWSALANLIDDRYNAWEQRRLQNAAVTRALIEEFATTARAHRVPLLVVGLDSSRVTATLLAALQEQGIAAADIAPPRGRREYTNLPHDGHPSPLAHRFYTERLARLLRPLTDSDSGAATTSSQTTGPTNWRANALVLARSQLSTWGR